MNESTASIDAAIRLWVVSSAPSSDVSTGAKKPLPVAVDSVSSVFITAPLVDVHVLRHVRHSLEPVSLSLRSVKQLASRDPAKVIPVHPGV